MCLFTDSTSLLLSLFIRILLLSNLWHAFNSCISPDLNVASMRLWERYPELALFPGTLVLADNRPDNDEYPSSSLNQAQLSSEEPALSHAACQDGARSYSQEGMHDSQQRRSMCSPCAHRMGSQASLQQADICQCRYHMPSILCSSY